MDEYRRRATGFGEGHERTVYRGETDREVGWLVKDEIDEVVDTRNMRQSRMDEWPGSGRGEEQKFVIHLLVLVRSVRRRSTFTCHLSGI